MADHFSEDMIKELKYIIFDFDGTLCDTAEDVWVSVRYGFEKHGFELPSDYSKVAENLSYTVPQMMSYLYPKSDKEIAFEIEKTVSYHYNFLNSFTNTKLYEGIEELLGFFKEKGLELYILSNKSQDALSRLLELNDWDKYFTVAKGTDASDRQLPKTERLKSFLSKREEIEKGRTCYIGDSYTDIIAAKANGLLDIGVLYGDGDPDKLVKEKPTLCFKSSNELYDFFINEVSNA